MEEPMPLTWIEKSLIVAIIAVGLLGLYRPVKDGIAAFQQPPTWAR